MQHTAASAPAAAQPAVSSSSSSSSGGSTAQPGSQPDQQAVLALVQQLLTQALPALPGTQSRQVANMLWALARLQFPWQESPQAAVAVRALTARLS